MENSLKIEENVERPQSILEEIGNAVTHGLGFIFGIVAFILLLVKSNTLEDYLGAFFFGISIMVLYLMSCLYHSFKNGSKVKKVFRIFDHTSIYILIGGTFAPILLCEIGGKFGWLFFYIQWGIILIGMILKIININRFKAFHMIMYLLLGWSGLMFMPSLLCENTPLFWLILSGGITYSAGIIFFAFDYKAFHFIWHFFVIFGTVLHFIGIYGFIY